MSKEHDNVEFVLRDLRDVEDYGRVFELEKQVWALETGDDAVPIHVFAASVKRGAILVGAFDASGELAGFVYSFPGLKGRRLVQWSHMLGVAPGLRGAGLGYRLKLAQRERALAKGIDLVEWTFDPLQAGNAHFNFGKLGVVATEYLRDVYGRSDSPLHKGTPTDRLVGEWYLRDQRVEARIGEAETAGGTGSSGGIGMVEGGASQPRGDEADPEAARLAGLPLVNRIDRRGEWQVCAGEPDLSSDSPSVLVAIPAGFTRMLVEAPDIALEWRLTTRRAFEAYFARGYRATGFVRDAETGGGRYVLRAANETFSPRT